MINELIVRSMLNIWSKDGRVFYTFDYGDSNNLSSQKAIAYTSSRNAQLHKI